MAKSNERTALAAGDTGEGSALGRAVASLSARYRDSPYTTSIQAVAFWLAVVLPFIHLPLLAAGLTSRLEALAFVGLITLNAVAVLAGHPHRQP